MKNTAKIIGLIAVLAIIAFSMTACGSGGAGGGQTTSPTETSAKYAARDGGVLYELEIFKAGTARAAYTPVAGDSYALTMIAGQSVKRSTGTIASYSNGRFELKNTKSGETFTAVISGETISSIPKPIPLDDGGKLPAPAALTAVKPGVPDTIYMTPGKWDGEWSGESWAAGGIKLSDITNVKPKKGDKLDFTISGNSNVPLKWVGIQLYQWLPNWEFKALGDTGNPVDIGASFVNKTFRVTMWGDFDPNYDILIQVVNSLWSKHESDYTHNSGEKLPANLDWDDTMATISNFKISLDVVTAFRDNVKLPVLYENGAWAKELEGNLEIGKNDDGWLDFCLYHLNVSGYKRIYFKLASNPDWFGGQTFGDDTYYYGGPNPYSASDGVYNDYWSGFPKSGTNYYAEFGKIIGLWSMTIAEKKLDNVVKIWLE